MHTCTGQSTAVQAVLAVLAVQQDTTQVQAVTGMQSLPAFCRSAGFFPHMHFGTARSACHAEQGSTTVQEAQHALKHQPPSYTSGQAGTHTQTHAHVLLQHCQYSLSIRQLITNSMLDNRRSKLSCPTSSLLVVSGYWAGRVWQHQPMHMCRHLQVQVPPFPALISYWQFAVTASAWQPLSPCACHSITQLIPPCCPFGMPAYFS